MWGGEEKYMQGLAGKCEERGHLETGRDQMVAVSGS
jgi:hypothetical protein